MEKLESMLQIACGTVHCILLCFPSAICVVLCFGAVSESLQHIFALMHMPFKNVKYFPSVDC